MAAPEIKLGLSGSETTLPATLWRPGEQGEPPCVYNIPVDKVQMLDGSVRYNFKSARPRQWTLEFAEVNQSALTSFITIAGYSQTLSYINNYESATPRNVVVTAFSYAPQNTNQTAANVVYYVTLTLEEVV